MKNDEDTTTLAEAMLAHLPVGVALYDAYTFCLLKANTSFLSLLDTFLAPCWRSERIIGHPLTEWGPPSYITHLTAIFRSVAETGTSFLTEESFFPTETNRSSWKWTLAPVRDANGQIVHLLQTLYEAPSRVPHTAIEDERVHLHAILDQLPEGVLITEVATGSISYANVAAATILGIPLTRLVGTPLHQHTQSQHNKGTPFNDQHLQPWQFAVIRALYREVVTSQETLVTRPDGSTVVVLTSSAPLWTEGGVMTEAVVVFQDITAHKSLEQQKSEFLWMANHELRTPITVIQGFAEILQLKAEEYHLDEFTLYALTQINEHSQLLTLLVEEMLDLSRIEQARFVLNFASHDLLRILTHVIEGQSVTTNKHSIQLIVQGLQSTDTLLGSFDEARIGQVLNNLISNAIKYSPSGGEIEVGLRFVAERSHEVLMWVKDSGIGIAANEIPSIFKRFYRASNLDNSLSGLGIGLYLVREVVMRHGGHVWVESVEGSGSTFYVLLPLNASPRKK